MIARRNLIAGAATLAVLSVVRVPVARAQLPDDVRATVGAIVGGRSPIEDGIDVEVPRVAENGAQVPVTIRLDSPMTEGDHVTAIHVVATNNPAPGIGSFRLTPRLARAEVFTRIRVAEGQDILVLAELSDGRVLQTAVRIDVSVGGCAT